MASQPWDHALHEETLHASRLLREWSQSLRSWSALARERSQESRRVRHASRPEAPVPVVVATGEPSLGEVPVTDLFVILVENHGFEVKQAVRLLTIGLVAAGYLADSEHVSAVDALDILDAILSQPRG